MNHLIGSGAIGCAALLVVCLAGQVLGQQAIRNHPNLYASDSDRAAIEAKINSEPWAQRALKEICDSVDPYVDRAQKQPDFVTSRLAMYWKEGERFTQCYLVNENWDRGEGNAPVPTVRLPGMRIWNDFVNVPLEDRTPYNQTGDMLATNRKDPSKPAQIVPYKNSGHLIRGNNIQILTLAERAAFLYWLRGEEKYARFAADIYWTWLLGTYYMKPVLDPTKSSGGPGGMEPGGILGYYDYEQIHDDLLMHAAPIYDFLYSYLASHPHEHLKVIGKDVLVTSGEVFKRFIDIGMIRGGKTGNWNVNGWNIMMRGILCLEGNEFYPDGHGREYYLHYFTTESTKWHDALPDILKSYDPVTGLWPESPGYAFGTINVLLDLAIPIQRAGVDTISGNAIMSKAALSVFPWMDPRGNLVVFGDTRGGPASFVTFERLLTYYQSKGDAKSARDAIIAIKKGIAGNTYDRSKCGWEGLCINVPLGDVEGDLPSPRVAYSPTHEHIVMRNLNDEQNGLMFTLYGGVKGKHLSPNGLAVQFYGKGWALGPDAAGYESYWSADHAYHQSATGSNTIIPGYTDGPIQIEAMEPSLEPDEFQTSGSVSPSVQFADVSAGEKRRTVAIVRTSPATGYYVDIFRSKQNDNDYIYHNVGNRLELTSPRGAALKQTQASLEPFPAKPYSYFKNVRRTITNDPFRATWTIDQTTPKLCMSMWTAGGAGRQIFQVDAPYTTIIKGVTPAGVSCSPDPTPTLIIRQSGADGWDQPFVSVFESSSAGQQTIAHFSSESKDGLVLAEVHSTISGTSQKRIDRILSSVKPTHTNQSGKTTFKGTFAMISSEEDGEVIEVYLGHGHQLKEGLIAIESADDLPISARLFKTSTGWTYTATRPVKLSVDGSPARLFPPAHDRPLEQ